MEYIQYSTKAIREYFHKFNQNEISINGLSVRLSKNKFHAVDSKPFGYQISILRCLDNLIESNLAKKIIAKSQIKATNYELTPYENQLKFNNIDFDCIYLKKNLILWDESIKLNRNYSLKIMEKEFKIIIKTRAKYICSSTSRRIGIWFKKNQFTPDEKIYLYEILRTIKEDLQEQKKNLFGFVIYIEKIKYLDSLCWDKDFLLNFEWSIRNLFSYEKSCEIKKEASR